MPDIRFQVTVHSTDERKYVNPVEEAKRKLERELTHMYGPGGFTLSVVGPRWYG